MFWTEAKLSYCWWGSPSENLERCYIFIFPLRTTDIWDNRCRQCYLNQSKFQPHLVIWRAAPALSPLGSYHLDGYQLEDKTIYIFILITGIIPQEVKTIHQFSLLTHSSKVITIHRCHYQHFLFTNRTNAPGVAAVRVACVKTRPMLWSAARASLWGI